MPKAVILSGDGINCERETAAAFSIVGFESQIVHINELIKNPNLYKNIQAFALPGGFSFGDELGSGKLLAVKLQYELKDYLEHILSQDTLVIGICNGFQALVSLGFLPGHESGEKLASLAFNLNSKGERIPFLNQWVDLRAEKSNCIWTKDLNRLCLPARHGEGRIVFKNPDEVYPLLNSQGQIPFKYEVDINGSYKKSAALSSKNGKIFGLMPHPEAAMWKALDPVDPKYGGEPGDGYHIFKNAFDYFQ